MWHGSSITANQLKTNRLTAIDLFAGAGGFSLAAKLCDIDVRAAVEHDFILAPPIEPNSSMSKQNSLW
jgi:hypothetical protein